MTKFKVANIHCENCANTIKNALEDEYGEIKVDLGVEPRVVSVNLRYVSRVWLQIPPNPLPRRSLVFLFFLLSRLVLRRFL